MTLDTSQHKSVLIKILKDIYSNSAIGPFLGFKGGTAVMLFYNLSRFSVDLDFDLLDSTKEELIFDELQKILQTFGTIKEARKKRYSVIFILSYNNKLHGMQNIKIEINKRDFGSKYELKQYMGIPIKVMVRPDIFAHKLVAMHERIGKANRDIFDVWFFLHNQWPINKEIITLRTQMPYKEFLEIVIADLEKTSDRSILSGLGELLDEKQKNWVRSKLKSETLFNLKLALEQ